MDSDALAGFLSDTAPQQVPGVLSQTDPWSWCNATAPQVNGSWPKCELMGSAEPRQTALELTRRILGDHPRSSSSGNVQETGKQLDPSEAPPRLAIPSGFSPGGLGVPCLPCDFMRDNRTVTEYMLSRPNRTQNVRRCMLAPCGPFLLILMLVAHFLAFLSYLAHALHMASSLRSLFPTRRWCCF